jgi:4-hydroxy-tetrahydrodipicolinate synthase
LTKWPLYRKIDHIFSTEAAMLKGSLVALITPFKDGKVDYDQLDRLVEFHIKSGTSGIVPVGTTGESATLSHKEHLELVSFVVKAAKGRIPVIAGSGSNATSEAIVLAQGAKEAGADAHLSIAPYYNKPTQEGLFLHFKAIAEAVSLPMVLYNVPGRTAVSISAETVGRLSRVPNVIEIKEATGDLRMVSEIIEASKPGFEVASGDDFTAFPLLSVGGVGSISVTANILPERNAKMFELYFQGKRDEALAIHYEMLPFHRMMFVETNPIPVKAAAYRMGIIDTLEYRLPLCPLGAASDEKLKQLLSSKGLLKR